MNPKLARMIAKGAAGLIVSAFIGYTMKFEKKVGDRIDEHFDKKDSKDN